MTLGKGLSALIPPRRNNNNQNEFQFVQETPPTVIKNEKPAKTESVYYIEIERVHPNSEQPRHNFDEKSLQELAQSIQEYGILQPLIVNKIEKDHEHGTIVEYEIISGERRWKAAKMAGLKFVPAIIREKSANDKEKLILAIIENIQREDLNSIEKAKAFQRLIEEFNLTHEEIAKKIGKSREAISNTIRLLKLPVKIQEGLLQNKITEGHARAIITIEDPLKQIWLYEEIVKKGLNVRIVEQIAKNHKVSKKKEIIMTPEFGEIKDYQDKLSKALNTKVDVFKSNNKWKVVINLYSKNDLAALIKKISN